TDQPLYMPIGDSVYLHPSQAEVARTPVPGFLCPSDGNSPYFSNHDNATTAGSNYVLNAGTGTGTYYDFRYPTDGLFWYGSRVRHKDITDGLSSTMFVSEALLGQGTDSIDNIPHDPRRQWLAVSCTAYPDPNRAGTIPPMTDDMCSMANMAGML